jgi:hypothetical protein
MLAESKYEPGTGVEVGGSSPAGLNSARLSGRAHDVGIVVFQFHGAQSIP